MRSFRPVLITLMFCLLFLFFSWRPLWHTDLWGHLAFGRQIVKTKSLDRLDELLTFDSELPLRDTAWLSQVFGYEIHELGGIAGLQMLYASCLTLSMFILWRIISRAEVSVWLGLLGLGLYWGVSWEQLKIIRPQLGGLVCYLLLFERLTNDKRKQSDWLLIPAIFALWANLHGSFPIGFLMLGSFLLDDILKKDKSQIVDIAGRARLLPSRLWFLPLCLIAVCLNPYGPLIYKAIIEIAANPNVKDLHDWTPIDLDMRQGRWALAVVILFVIVKSLARRKTEISLWLLVLGFGVATLGSSRMLLWFAPAILYAILLQTQSLWERQFGKAAPRERRSPGFLFGGIPIFLVVFTFFFTPLGWEFVSGKTQDPHRSLSAATPVEATEALLKHPVNGIVMNRSGWGDYLIWKSEGRIKPFSFSHAHLIPEAVWQDYLRIISDENPPMDLLDRYDVAAVLISPVDQSKLCMLLENSDDWMVEYKSDLAILFLRIGHAPHWPSP